MDEGNLLWEPSAERVERATLTRYQRWVEETRGRRFDDYHDLWRWSVEDLDDFWRSIWEFFDVRSHGEWERALSDASMPGAVWFEGARLNYAEHLFRGKRSDEVAIIHASELRELGEWTWADLRSATAGVAAGLRELGVGPGDRVVGYLPNLPETIAAFLACASLGAIWSSCSPDFGARSVIDRFAQIEPKVLFAVDGYRYNGRDFDRRDVVARLQVEMPSLERTVVLPYLDSDPDLSGLDAAMTWDELVQDGKPLEFELVPFGHPLWVLYSSGTTGLPKAIVHGHGGILLEHLKVLNLHVDAQPGDRVFWFTTTGWMMWNFLVSALHTEAAIVLYDGSPGHPDLGVLWDLAERTGMTHFGTCGQLRRELHEGRGQAGRGPRPVGAARASARRARRCRPRASSGSTTQVGRDTWLFSTSGGTDVCSAFVGGVPTLPVYEGELQARSLGAKIEAFDEDGNAVTDEVGELVLTAPLPSMPVSFWNDEDGSRLREAYFDYFPGVWRHGDWIRITPRGTAVIYGRSDSTINRGGVRMGTSEIYRAVLAIDEIADALVVDVPREGSENWMPLFVVLREGAELDDDLVAEIRKRIREDCSPRHVPNDVFAVKEVPRTLSGKLLEVPVKRILSGTDPEKAASRDSLANPKALDWFVELAQKE